MNSFYNIPFNDLNPAEMNENAFLSFITKRFSFHKQATYSISKVEISLIKPLTKYVFKPRLKKTQDLIDKYKLGSIDIFKPLLLNYANQYLQIISPPILEIRDSNLVLCDGTHRVFTAMQNQETYIYSMVINGVTIPLPGEINSWEKVKVLDKQVSVAENFINFKTSYFTGYTGIFNGENVWKKYNSDINIVLK